MPIQQQHIQSLSALEFKARQVVEGFLAGLHKSPFHGFSVEFAEHRAYNSGESTRHIAVSYTHLTLPTSDLV